MSYPQKKIIITGQNDAEGKIYVTGYEEEDADTQIDQTLNKVNIDDGDNNGIDVQVDTIKKLFGSTQTGQTLTEAREQASLASAPTPAPAAEELTATPAPAPAQPPITIEEFNAMPIPWRVDTEYSNTKVSDYINWIKDEKKRGNVKRSYGADTVALVQKIVKEYNRLIQKDSITQDELTSFFNLTENEQIKQIGGKTKKLRAFRKKTLRNQRKSKKRLGSRKNIR